MRGEKEFIKPIPDCAGSQNDGQGESGDGDDPISNPWSRKREMAMNSSRS